MRRFVPVFAYRGGVIPLAQQIGECVESTPDRQHIRGHPEKAWKVRLMSSTFLPFCRELSEGDKPPPVAGAIAAHPPDQTQERERISCRMKAT